MEEKSTPNVIFNLKYDTYSKTRNPFSSCRQNGRKRNVVDYINDGAKESMNIVDYTNNKEKSAGAFDRKGLMTGERLEQMKEKLRKTHSVIWRGVISFEDEFGDSHMRCYEDAHNLMKTQLPKFIKSAGLDYGNVVWFAAMHRNTEHRHIHLVFFERRGTHKRKGQKVLGYSRGNLPPEAFAEFKLNMENYLSGTWRQVVMARDKLIDGVRDKDNVRNLHLGSIQKDILKLAALLPKEGRLGYNSENMKSLRPMIDEITKSIFYSDPFAKKWYGEFVSTLQQRDEETVINRICNKWDAVPRTLEAKMMSDLYARMGNQIIQFAVQYKSDINVIESRRSGRIATKHIKRRRTNGMFDEALKLAQNLSFEPFDYFQQYLAKLEEFEREERQRERQNEMEM